jgi:hypothetical protein
VCLLLSYPLILVALWAVSSHVTLPTEDRALDPGQGGVGVAAHLLLGRGGGTDFLADYASAHALVHHVDPYTETGDLVTRLGLDWSVSTANPHPPTQVSITMPFLALSYPWALTAWALAMVYVVAATMRLVGVPLLIAIAIAIGLALSFPGAYAIGNPVAIVGLGIAMAWRWRYDPVLAGAGIAVAAAPKASGLLLMVPFLFARRLRVVAVGAASHRSQRGPRRQRVDHRVVPPDGRTHARGPRHPRRGHCHHRRLHPRPRLAGGVAHRGGAPDRVDVLAHHAPSTGGVDRPAGRRRVTGAHRPGGRTDARCAPAGDMGGDGVPARHRPCYVAMFGLPVSARDDFWVPAPLDHLIRRIAPKALVKR